MNPKWLNDCRLNCLSAEKRNLIRCGLKHCNSNEPSAILSSFIALNSFIKEKNISFSEKEKTILYDIAFDYMTPEERENFCILQKAFKKSTN